MATHRKPVGKMMSTPSATGRVAKTTGRANALTRGKGKKTGLKKQAAKSRPSMQFHPEPVGTRQRGGTPVSETPIKRGPTSPGTFGSRPNVPHPGGSFGGGTSAGAGSKPRPAQGPSQGARPARPTPSGGQADGGFRRRPASTFGGGTSAGAGTRPMPAQGPSQGTGSPRPGSGSHPVRENRRGSPVTERSIVQPKKTTAMTTRAAKPRSIVSPGVHGNVGSKRRS